MPAAPVSPRIGKRRGFQGCPSPRSRRGWGSRGSRGWREKMSGWGLRACGACSPVRPVARAAGQVLRGAGGGGGPWGGAGAYLGLRAGGRRVFGPPGGEGGGGGGSAGGD